MIRVRRLGSPMTRSEKSNPFISGMWTSHSTNGKGVRRLFSTDHLAGRADIEIEAAKTGYTDTARYCFSTLLQLEDGRRVVISLLGAEGKDTRWADVNRVLSWLEAERG